MRILPALGLLAISSAASAQSLLPIPVVVPVTDASSIAKNALVLLQQKIEVDQAQEQADLTRRMGRSVNLFAPLIRYRMPNPPRYRTRWPDGLSDAAKAFVDVLNAGGIQAGGYDRITVPIVWPHTVETVVARIPSGVREAFRRRLSIIGFQDVVTEDAAGVTGRVRGMRKPYREVMAALEDSVTVSGGTTQEMGKIAANLLHLSAQTHVAGELEVAITRQIAARAMLRREASASALLFNLGTRVQVEAPGEGSSHRGPEDWVIR